MHVSGLLTWLLSVGSAVALDSQLVLAPNDVPNPKTMTPNSSNTIRVAIIGAGAGGSSAAFWIKKAQERHGLNITVDIFEKLSHIGGRAAIVHPYNDHSLGPQELGADVFVPDNKNLFRAVKEFNLTLANINDGEVDMGIWNGEKFVITFNGSLLDKVKSVLRYGYFAQVKTTAIVKRMVEHLLLAYIPALSHWPSMPTLGARTGLSGYTGETAYSLYKSQGVNVRFIREVIESATRMTYAQDTTYLHSLVGAVSMDTGEATQVEGGNYQIFEAFVKYSGATLHLNTSIAGLRRVGSKGRPRWLLSSTTKNVSYTPYDHIVLATPFHLSGISLADSLANFPVIDYIHLHVTYVSTTSPRPAPERFGLKPGSNPPKTILTTAEGLRNGGVAPDFQSISYIRSFEYDGRTEYLYSLFSLDRKSDEWLESLFGKGTLGWVYRKEWDAYPRLPPRKEFPPIKADDGL